MATVLLEERLPQTSAQPLSRGDRLTGIVWASGVAWMLWLMLTDLLRVFTR